MQEFELAIRRQLAAAERAYFFIIQESSSNVLNNLTVRDTDGKVYEVKGEEDAERHRAMLVERGWVFGYVPREEYVSYRPLEDGEVREGPFDLKQPVE
jgi:hypothetical protein